MSVTVTKQQSAERYVLSSNSATGTIPPFGSRDSVLLKNSAATDMTWTVTGTDTVDGDSTINLGPYSAVELIRGATEWKAVSSYDKRENESINETVYGDLEVLGDITDEEGTAYLGAISALPSLDTTTAVGDAFTNQPANDGIEVLSDSNDDTTQTVTIIGTTTGTDTVVVETVTLTGTTAVSTAKTNWGVVLAVKKSAATAGTVTVREASGNATITAGLTAEVLSVGVNTVDAADQAAYNRLLSIVASGSTTKQIGLKGTDNTDAVIYDSQALTGTTAVLSNSVFRTITEIYTGDLEGTRTATVTNNTDLDINGAPLGYTRTAYGVGTAYAFTNTAAAIDFGTTDPSITLAEAGTYVIYGQVQLAYNAATVVAETATVKVRRTNNTAADLSSVVVIDLPVATTLTHSYGVVTIPPVVYTTTATDDVVTLFGNVSAGLGAGTIDATAVGTSIVAVRIK